MPIIDEGDGEGTPALIAAVTARFVHASDGMLRDVDTSDEPHWLVSDAWFRRWFGLLEAVSGQPLGRRLAHAAAESEEWRQRMRGEPPSPWLGRRKKRLAWLNGDWEARGLGEVRLLREGPEETALVVEGRALTPMSAGMANAGWELLEGQRSRFRWEDQGAEAAVATLTLDPRDIPQPIASKLDWQDRDGDGAVEIGHPLGRVLRDGQGTWLVDGERHLLLARDLLMRMDQLAAPQIEAAPTSLEHLETEVLDGVWRWMWKAHVEAARRCFFDDETLVLVAEPEHWFDVGQATLTRAGLGRVGAVHEAGEHGAVRLELPAMLHPGLVSGLLLGAWERAEGRVGRVTWSLAEEGGHVVELGPRHAIAVDDTSDDA